MTDVRTRVLRIGKATLELGERTLVMGVINVTPDSFFDGGRDQEGDRAFARAFQLLEEGADILDIGGESTRPGAEPVPEDVEIARTVPVILEIRKQSDALITIDTTKSGVARRALEAGADAVNDISGMTFDPAMRSVIGDRGCTVVIGHIQGAPPTMQRDPSYQDVVEEVREFLARQAGEAVSAGVPRDRIVVDPGIGFGKTVEHNLQLIAGLSEIASLGFPVALGVSRKGFIGRILGLQSEDRLEGSLAAGVLGAWNGADILRVHDVRSTVRAVRILDAVRARARRARPSV